jgi:hypothetical protein
MPYTAPVLVTGATGQVNGDTDAGSHCRARVPKTQPAPKVSILPGGRVVHSNPKPPRLTDLSRGTILSAH